MRAGSWWIVVLAVLALAVQSDRSATLTAIDLQAQGPLLPIPDPSTGLVYVCPMDPDVRSHDPGGTWSRARIALTAQQCALRRIMGAALSGSADRPKLLYVDRSEM